MHTTVPNVVLNFPAAHAQQVAPAPAPSQSVLPAAHETCEVATCARPSRRTQSIQPCAARMPRAPNINQRDKVLFIGTQFSNLSTDDYSKIEMPWTLAAALDSDPEQHDGREDTLSKARGSALRPGRGGRRRRRRRSCERRRRSGRRRLRSARRRRRSTRPAPRPAVARGAGARALCRAAGGRMRVRGAAQAGADSRSGQSRRVRAGAAVGARGRANTVLVLPRRT